MDNLVYEDIPQILASSYNRNWTKPFIYSIQMLPVWLIPLALLILVFDRIQQEVILGIFALADTLLMAFVVLAPVATKHQIFKDKMRIVLGWIFHLDIPFSNIENIREAAAKDFLGFHLSFISFSQEADVLQITRKHGVKVNIIPGNRKLFREHLNKALDDWRRYNPG